MSIYLEILGNNKIIFSNVPDSYHRIFKESKNSKRIIQGKKIRSLSKKDKDGITLWMVAEDDNDLFKSKKAFTKTYNLYHQLSNAFFEYYLSMTESNMHTISTIQAKMSQKIDSLISHSQLRADNYEIAKKKIKDIIQGDLDKTAEVVFDLHKRVDEIDHHINSLSLINSSKTKITLKKHPLKKSLLNIYNPFLTNFRADEIKVDFNKINNDIKVNIDYDVFALAMHHFFHNVEKYCKPNTTIIFMYSRDDKLIIKMHSLKIEDKEKIFDEGYSGKNIDKLAGHGIGMHVIKKSLNLMNMSITVDHEPLQLDDKNDKNTFVIEWKKTLQ